MWLICTYSYINMYKMYRLYELNKCMLLCQVLHMSNSIIVNITFYSYVHGSVCTIIINQLARSYELCGHAYTQVSAVFNYIHLAMIDVSYDQLQLF